MFIVSSYTTALTVFCSIIVDNIIVIKALIENNKKIENRKQLFLLELMMAVSSVAMAVP